MATLSAKERYESHLISLYGPKPVNIFTSLRESIGLSHAELGYKMFTTKQSLIRLEQGLFESPLPAALDFWVDNYTGVTYSSLVDQYENYQDLMRKRHHHFFNVPVVPYAYELKGRVGDPHPLKQLRQRCYGGTGASVTEVAKALCVNQATLQYWEKRWRSQKSVPKSFNGALLSIGYNHNDLVLMNSWYNDWRRANGRSNGTN